MRYFFASILTPFFCLFPRWKSTTHATYKKNRRQKNSPHIMPNPIIISNIEHMALYKFTEILNDLVDYFILSDPHCLLQYKTTHGLPDDLLTEFTTQDTGDVVVEEGIIIPLARVNNYPYTIYFNLTNDTPELLKPGNDLQVRQDGYCLKVESGRIYLFTMPYLRNFTADAVAKIAQLQRATVEVPNGWYEVSVLGGQTLQEDGLEPTFEFLLKAVPAKPVYAGDIGVAYDIDCDVY